MDTVFRSGADRGNRLAGGKNKLDGGGCPEICIDRPTELHSFKLNISVGDVYQTRDKIKSVQRKSSQL